MFNKISLTLLLVVGLTCASQAADIYVNAAAPAGGDGSKATPYQTINMALYAANAASDADTIHVAEGIYKYSDPNDPNSTGTGWTITYPVTIMGGYTASFNLRDSHAHKTVLSGDASGNDIDVSLFENSNAYNDPNVTKRMDNKNAFSTISAVAAFDGLFFTNFGTVAGQEGLPGVGAYLNASGCTVNDCVFTKFACSSIISIPSNDQTITNCRFENNGVGRASIRSDRYKGNVTVDNCTFIGNSASSDLTDAIYAERPDANQTWNVKNCLFAEGMYSGANNASGIQCKDAGATLNVENCVFLSNESTAGVLFFSAQYANHQSFPTTSHVLNVKRCLFTKNLGTAANGTLLLRYDTTDATQFMTVNIDHSVIADNWDRNAAGIKIDRNTEKPSNMVINIKNSIIWGNKRPDGTATDNLSWSTTIIAFTNTTYNPFNITYSCIDTSDPNNLTALQYGNETPRTGLIFTDPKFVDPNNNDYHLQATSPCVDAGEPGLAYVGEESRPYHGYRQNIGLYGGTREATNKTNPCSITADSDNNGVVDLSDLSNLRLQWLKSCP